MNSECEEKGHVPLIRTSNKEPCMLPITDVNNATEVAYIYLCTRCKILYWRENEYPKSDYRALLI